MRAAYPELDGGGTTLMLSDEFPKYGVTGPGQNTSTLFTHPSLRRQRRRGHRMCGRGVGDSRDRAE